jgi:CRISPR-associated protein Csx10
MSGTKFIRYTVELKLPLLATDIEGEPNSAISHSYIPGSLLRGALVSLYLGNEGRGRRAFDAVADSEARAIFVTNETRFLHAYPISESGQRALPLSFAWRYNKEDHHTEEDKYWKVYDLSRSAPPKCFHEQEISHPFVCWNSGVAEFLSPARQINVHTQRDARKGRATGESGTIYRYDALASGLRLQGLVIATPGLAQTLRELLPLNQALWLGRARRAGYGETKVIEVETLDYWRESEIGAPSAIEAGEELRVTFVSDALLRNEFGQASMDPRRALAAALSTPADSLTLLPERSWADSKIAGGFNRKWGLPLPQAAVISAGSVFTYRTSDSIDANALFEIEREGIGERRNEGFGRVLVNWLQGQEGQFESHRPDLKSAIGVPEALSAEAEKMARTIGSRLLRLRLDKELRMRVNYTKLVPPFPSKTQLTRLRVILRAIQAGRGRGQADIQRLEAYLDNLRRTAKRQFEPAAVEHNGVITGLLEWLKSNFKQPAKKWPMGPLCLGRGPALVEIPLDERMAEEYGLRLIDQVLYRATKDAQQKR